MSEGFFRPLDAVFVRVLRLDEEDEHQYASRRAGVENREHVLYDMDIIDSKSSALLTHVSIMLAVVAVLKALGPGRIYQLLLSLELIAFSIVAMLLLRCVDVMGPPFRQPPDTPQETNSLYLREVLVRRAIYQAMVRSVLLLTIALIGIVLARYIGASIL